MPTVRIDSAFGPVELYYEATGAGAPLVWCHEYGGDHRSWEPQVRYFARRHRVVTWNYRGYPPSDVPKEPEAYSVDALVEDLRGLLGHLGIARAHVGGLSMGAGVALNFGIRHPELTESLIVAAAGAGTVNREEFLRNSERLAGLYETRGVEAKVANLEQSPARRGFAEKDPRGWAETVAHVRDHSGLGSALMMRGVQMKRKTIYELGPEMARITAPALIVVGDQDEPCLEPGLFMKRHIPHAGLAVVPMTGHASNLEEPALFNQLVADFLASVETGRWGTWQRAGR
jgi:pimeloyl-ACP methyl ester carboxylesterase